MASWLKKAKKALKKATRSVAKVISHAAPIVGAVIGGPVGAAIGTGLGAAAAQVGPNKNRSAQLQRSLISGAAVIGGTAALGLVSGAGIGAPIYKSAESIFGGGSPANQEVSSGNPEWDKYVAEQEALNASGNPTTDPVSIAIKTAQNTAAAMTGGGQNAAGLKQQYLDQLALAEKLRQQGDPVGAAQAAALAETYRVLLEQTGQQVPTGGGIDPLWIVGGLALLALTSRGKAA
jgi:hypothetical protein